MFFVVDEKQSMYLKLILIKKSYGLNKNLIFMLDLNIILILNLKIKCITILKLYSKLNFNLKYIKIICFE